MTRTHNSLPLYKTPDHYRPNLFCLIFHEARKLVSSGGNLCIKPIPQTHNEASGSEESVDGLGWRYSAPNVRHQLWTVLITRSDWGLASLWNYRKELVWINYPCCLQSEQENGENLFPAYGVGACPLIFPGWTLRRADAWTNFPISSTPFGRLKCTILSSALADEPTPQ